MSTSGVTALDHTVQETNVWLRESLTSCTLRIATTLTLRCGPCCMRCATEFPPEVAVHFGAQLPMLVRGIYYRGLAHGRKAGEGSQRRGFCRPRFAGVAATISDGSVDRGPRCVRDPLREKLDPDEFTKLMDHLPASVRNLRT